MTVTNEDRLIFVTSNPSKAIEAERILGVPLFRVSIDLPEIQASNVEEIARFKLGLAREKEHGRLIVEDVSLGFDALGNFPGPYVRWLLQAAGGEGLAAIARGLGDPAARAQCCIGYWDGVQSHTFLGQTRGRVLAEARGDRSFGWDPWFVPEGSAKSFGEMTDEEKDAVSHRGIAYRRLAAHLADRSAGRA